MGRILASAMMRLSAVFVVLAPFCSAGGTPSGLPAAETAWWVWPALLFVISFVVGIIAVLGGGGGGVLFVPLVGGFLPIHLDFVRCTSLLMALAGALAASPNLMRRGLVSIRLALPVAVVASCSSIVGALIGMSLPENVVRIALGSTILGIVGVMASSRRSDRPRVDKPDPVAAALRITGIYVEPSTGQEVSWQPHRTPLGLVAFVFIGLIAGMFGLGAGWANVPVLNLLMGVPLKVAVATSGFVLTVTGTSAAWIYINHGAALPMVAVPSVLGMMLGAMIGSRLLARTKPRIVRTIILTILVFAGIRSLLQGTGVWP